ncbi:Alpha/Beta hydrolase protein [Kockovaella imperatae]|uniref:Alpha/Beta hydrolase protein n=1 Tax=Kockovaella imperatae TaxID=4999 RepID=A0A1Y1UE63_9TREE|nr:Alpha/Beta hydrolase protein [Kockovaella imperatae]ORX36341.1 Alpha/Beta hydrolase protein [Kockovaella imperatae]
MSTATSSRLLWQSQILLQPSCRGALRSRAPVVRSTPRPRGYSTWPNDIKPVDLAFDLVEPQAASASDQTLVICHGLFGSKQNWRSLAKAFAQRLGMRVYTLDLRNHGASPHAEPHTYAAMAEDIAHFFRTANLDNGVNLLGHSMGGKSVMALALNDRLNSPLRSLISVDMSPAKGRLSPEFAAYTEAMMEINEKRVKSRAEADEILRKTEPILSTRQFLLTNTKMSSGPEPVLQFRIPLPLLSASVESLGSFPYDPPPPVSWGSPEWRGPTLFLKGEHSKYLNRHNIPTAEAFFPNMKLVTLDAGHWVHAEQPAETIRVVSDFIESA